MVERMDLPDVEAVMASLASERPLFHSEADFQHALAWQIRVAYPGAQVRLEMRPRPGMRLDARVVLSGCRIGIELKYLARKLRAEVGGELFELPNQGAQDVRRYDFVKDLARLEDLVRVDVVDVGVAIALTNDASYWNPIARSGVADEAFRIGEGRSITGKLAWAAHTGAGTMRTREIAIHLKGNYTMSWREFSQVPTERNGTFRYLTLRLSRQGVS